MPETQNIWDADWQPYDDDTDPFAGDWEATTPGAESPWQADWQEEVEEAPTFGGRVKESWGIGKKQVSIGQLSFGQILGDKTPETEAQIQAIEETIPQGPRPSRGLPEQAFRAAAEMAPIPLTGMERGLRRGTALGLGFGAIATLGGPAAPITVPAAAAAGFSIGMISASLENIGGIEAGLAYRELKALKDPETGQKMDEGIAKAVGLGVGAINGAIELLQIKTFLRSIPGAESLVRKGITESVKKVLKSKALKSIVFRAGKKYATGVGIETGQELLQETTNISGQYLATELNNAFKGTNIPQASKKEIINRLVDTGKQSALAFSVFMAPGTAVSTTQEAIDRRAAGPGEADLLKPDEKTEKDTARIREDFNTGKINSSQLKDLKAQFPKKHPLYKVIDDLLKESEATTPETDMMTGEVINLKPEEEIPPTVPLEQIGAAVPIEVPETAIPMPGSYPPLAGISARESAQVFEQDRIREEQERLRIEQEQVERERLTAQREAEAEQRRKSLATKEGLKEQLRAKEEKADIEGMEFKVPYLRGLLEQVKVGEPGRRLRVTDYDGTEKWFGVPSDYPDFMKNRYNKKEVIQALEKGLSGYVFPEHEVRQASIWEDAKSEAYQMRNRDLRLAGEMYIEEPTTIEGLDDKSYKLLITELQHEGYSTREIEEIAARHRKTIEGDVIASIGNEYGFSKEEIQEILDDPMEPASDLESAWKETTFTKPVAAYLTPITEAEVYESEKERRLARAKPRRKETPGRAILEREAGKQEAGPSGVFQEASPDEIEQKGQLIAKLINGNLFPGHKVKYDGVWPGMAPDMPDMYQFTAYAGPAKGATFISKELEADAVKDKLEDTVEKFSKTPPVKEFKEAIDRAAGEAETAPTEAQIEAGNYKKGHVSLYGLDITIENPKGSVRTGVDRSGKKWSTEMKHHYGYILRTEDKDGDQIDVFIGDDISSDKVFVINQIDPGTKNFDEHKVMIGFPTEKQARVGYLANYERGWKGLGNIVSLSVDQFKSWLKYGDQTKPASKADIKGHGLEFMAEHKTKAELDKVYQAQVKQLTERAGPDKFKRAEMLAKVIAAYKIESKKYPAEKEPVAKAPAPKALKEILKHPSSTEAEVTREKAHLKSMVIEGVKSGKYKGAVRFSTVIDLKKTVEADKLYVSREGAIHATPILGPDDDAFPAYGSYKNHAVAYIIPEKYIKEKPDAHTKEVLIDPDTPLGEVTFLVDGQDKEFNIIELISALDARPDAVDLIKQYRDEYGESEALEFYKDIRGGTGRFKWQGAVVHRSTVDPDGWRITYFDAEGFSGHSEFKTIDEAVSEAIDSGFETPEPGLLDKAAAEPGFLEGTLKVYKAQKEHAKKMAAIEKEPEKELWQMTKAEQLEKVGRPVSEHREVIVKAHKENKTIPTEVLDDFPEISKRLGFVKKEKASPVNDLIGEITADIMPNNNLKRGLDYYATQYKDFTIDQLKELREWTKTQNPYVSKRLGGNVQTEIMFREEKAAPAVKDPWALTQEEYLEGDARKQRREEAFRAADLAAGPIRNALMTIGFLREGEYLEPALIRKAEQQSEFFTDPTRRGTKKSGTGLQELSDKAWTEPFENKEAAEEFRKAALAYFRGHRATWLEKGETFESPNILTPAKHEALVKEALDKGEQVPEKVLAKYPRLKKAEPLELTPEKGTLWERQAELEKEGAVERPAKGKKVKAAFGEKPITGAGVAGRQQGLFGYEKGETTDMFAEAEKGEGQVQAPPKKVAPPAGEGLEKAKKEEIEPIPAQILEDAGLTVTETLTKPKKAGKKPRPVWEVAGRLEPFVEIIRDLGGRKWGGKYSFWDDPTEALAEAIQEQGGMTFAEQLEVKQERAEGKAERLEERVGKARGRVEGARKAEDRIAGMIPMGQPILVGHHSEKRARRDQDRIQKLTRDQITEGDKARWLEDRARLQRDVAKGEYSLRFMENRLDDANADVRKLERILSGEHYGADPIRNQTYRERIAKNLADAQEKVDYWQQGIEAAGGIKYSKDNLKKGDRVKIRGAWCAVIRANPKTVSIVVAEGGAEGMKLKYKYSEITDSDIQKPAAKEIEKPAEKAAIPERVPKKPAGLDKKQKGKIASLRKAADNLQKQIDEKRDPAVASQNITVRRAGQIASAAADADRLERIQMVMRGLADDAEKGTLLGILEEIGTRAQIEQILTTKSFSPPSFHRSNAKYLIAAVKGVKGMAKERGLITDIVRRRGEYQIELYNKEEIKAVEAAIRQDPTNLKRVRVDLIEGKRLLALNIKDQVQYDAVRDKLLEYVSPPDPITQTQAKIREKEAALIGVKIPGFFPTPGPVAAIMVDAADIQPGDNILEPSAGKGDLAAIIKEAHPGNDMQVAEIGYSMREILELKGFDIIGVDFLEMELSKPGVQGLDVPYDKIIMNPPFEHFQDIDHVYHAYELLAPGGRLVSLMSEAPFHRSEKKADEFRKWLDKVGAEDHKLADKSFTGKEAFRQTGISARMVIIDKPGEKVVKSVQEPAAAPWGDAFPNVVSHTNANKVETHPDHEAAKKGDINAAIRLVEAVFKIDRAKDLAKRHPGSILVAVHSEEAAGRNKIPQAFAEAISAQTDLAVDDDIVQTNFTAHTKKNGLQRLLSRAIFDGKVEKGRDYIILDDVITQGGTVSELRQYIIRNGGNVVEVTSLAAAQFSSVLAIKPDTVNKLIDKYGRIELENILKENGIASKIEALTQSEARQIALYKGPDSFRSAIAAERQKAGIEGGETVFQKQAGEKVRPYRPWAYPTGYDLKQAKKALNILKNTLSKVLPAHVMQHIVLDAAPILDFDLTREDTQRSLQDWGGTLETISGASTINNFNALVEIAYNYDNDSLETTSYHEAFHVACKWLLPNKDYANLMRYFKDNEEAAAVAFSDFAMKIKGRDLSAHPNFIKAIFLKLRRYFQMIRNGLQGKGFARPEDVFGKLVVGEYKINLPNEIRLSRLNYAAQTKNEPHTANRGKSFSVYSRGKFTYEISCVGCNDVDALELMVDTAKDVPYEEFMRNVDADELAEMFNFYDWGDETGGLKLKDDYAVSYYKSTYQDRPVYFMQHSAIEYVFTEGDKYYSKAELPAEPMYSQLVNAVETAENLPKKVPSLLKWLQRYAKPEEIKWLNVEPWLKAHVRKDGTIDRKAFLEFLKDSQITVTDVFRYERGSYDAGTLDWSTPVETPQDTSEIYDGMFIEFETYAVDPPSQDVYTIIGSVDAGYNLFIELGQRPGEKHHVGYYPELDDAKESALSEYQEHHEFEYPETRYDAHTIRGGTDYRELLLVHPPTGEIKNVFKVVAAEGKYQVKNTETGKPHPENDPPGFFYSDYNEAAGKAMDLNMTRYKYGTGRERQIYSSPHWDQPDVLAHVRFKTRLDEESHKKILFIEEVQSDWHQAGKKYGYSGDPSRPGPVLTIVENTGQLGEPPTAKYWAMANGVILAGGQTEAEARINAAGILEETTDERLKQPPPAPFAKTWHELAMKRMLHYAVEKGYDTMAWTTGEQQIKRYDLRKHIDLINWSVANPEYPSLLTRPEMGTLGYTTRLVLTGYSKGEQKFTQGVNIINELDDFVGKNIADQIRIGINRGDRHGSIDAKNLVIGGEGMVAFYDKLLPGFMSKYGKQWGATVEKTEIVTGRELVTKSYAGPTYTVDELKTVWAKSDAAAKAEPEYIDGVKIENLYSLTLQDSLTLAAVIQEMQDHGTSFFDAMLDVGTESLAMALNGEIVKGWGNIKDTVHSVDLTPDMRKEVFYKGQTLFDKGKQLDGKAWAQQYIADAFSDAADNPKDKGAQAKAKRIRVEQEWFNKEWPRAAYESAKEVIKAFKMGKKKDWVGMKPDTTFLERWIQTPEFYYEKVPAAWRVFMASMERQDDRNQFYNDLTQKDVLLGEVINFKKANPGEYARLQKLMVRADQIKATHGPKSLRELGFSDQAITAFLAFRQMMDNGFDALYAEMAQVIAEYEEAGLDLPEVATWVGDKQVVVNLKMALVLMGNMRGWYFPRQRKSGNWMLTAKKKGVNPIMEIFETYGFANLRGNELSKQGYEVNKTATKQLPEDVYQLAGKNIGLNAMINMALSKVIPEKMPTFEEFGLKAIMRTAPSGRKDFIVRGPTNKKLNAVLKHLGGRNFSSAPGEPRAWHFTDAPDDMSFRVLRAIITSKGIPGAAESDLLFAHALTTEVANVVKGRGFRSAMIARRPETGKDVWVGYDTDLVEVASQYVTGLASGLAKKQVASKMVQAVTGTDVTPQQFESFEDYLDEVNRRRIDPDKQKNIFHDVTNYIQEMLRNQEFSDRVIGVIKGVTVLKYLGFRLASPLVNLTALLTSVPATMHGLAKIPGTDTFKYLVKAMDAYRTYAFGDKSKLEPDIEDMFDHIRLKGWDTAQYNLEALAVLRSKLGNRWKGLMEISMFMFGATEKVNRVATIMGTYMALKDQGEVDVLEMRDLSKRVSDRSHGVYGKTTYPYIALGKNPAAQAAQAMYVFSKFSHTYLQNMYDLGYKRHQWKSLLWMGFAPAIISGAGSIPFVWPLLMSSLSGILDVDEPEERFYSWFDDNLGEFVGNIVRYGAAGFGGYGVSLKGSLSIDPVETVPTRLPEIFGAPGNVVTDLWDGGKSLFKGDVFDAAKTMGPRVTGSMIQAYNEQRYGVTTRKKTPKFLKGEKMQPENLDSILRFLNFNPAHMAKIKEQKWSETRLVGKYRDLRSDLYSRIRGYYHKPQVSRSTREYLALLADIDQYNKRVGARDLDRIKGISYITKQSIKTALKLKK